MSDCLQLQKMADHCIDVSKKLWLTIVLDSVGNPIVCGWVLWYVGRRDIV